MIALGIGGKSCVWWVLRLAGAALVAGCAITLTVVPALASQSLYLRCKLVASSGVAHEYVLRVEVPDYFGVAHVTLVGTNTSELKVVRFDDTLIIADLDQRMLGDKIKFKLNDGVDWPDKANAMEFRLNRITGGAELNYLQKQPTTEMKNEWSLVMEGFSEKGSCSKSDRAF